MDKNNSNGKIGIYDGNFVKKEYGLKIVMFFIF
jgi:hypothetical protein